MYYPRFFQFFLAASSIASSMTWGMHIKNHSSASILPYCVRNGRVYLLLGLETVTWKGGQEDCWADWGGKKDKDENAWQTASREFTEETRGYFQDKLDLSRPTSAPLVYSYVTKGKKAREVIHYAFLMQIDWIDPKAIKTCTVIVDNEKKDCQWFGADVFVTGVTNNAKYDDVPLHNNCPIRFNFFNLCKEPVNLVILRALAGTRSDFHRAPRIMIPAKHNYAPWKWIAIPVALAGIYGIYHWWWSEDSDETSADNEDGADTQIVS